MVKDYSKGIVHKDFLDVQRENYSNGEGDERKTKPNKGLEYLQLMHAEEFLDSSYTMTLQT